MSTAAAPSAPALPEAGTIMSQAGAENFPVASRLLGARYRRPLLAIYGFARLVDDTGDEAAGDRVALLDEIEAQLEGIYAGRAPAHAVMRELAWAVRACALPEGPFRRLVQANRRDQLVTRYQTFEELLDYCQLSAAPVGELVLHVFGAATPQRVALSDRVCAGLQVIEHLQDVGEDYARGRVYLPAEELAAAGCAESELGAPVTSPPLRAVVAQLAGRCGSMLEAGAPLVRELRGRPRLAVAGFVAGGRSTLAAIEAARYDVLGVAARRSRRGFALAALKAVIGR